VTGFDVFSLFGGNTAYLSSGNNLYTLNLTTAALTSVGTFSGGALRDIAVVPEPSTYALLGLGALAASFRLRPRRPAIA
jgi:hypothetical protein